MIPISDTERRRAFSVWLRTGRLPAVKANGDVELKFNPWHDPADGRFTFAGAGHSYGQNGGVATARGAWPRQTEPSANHPRPHPASPPKAKAAVPAPRPPLPKPSAQRPLARNGWAGGGFSGGGGGDFGGGGASSTEPWGDDSPKQRPTSSASATVVRRQTPAPPTKRQHSGTSATAAPLHREVRNGYEYQIDDQGRTRRVSGTIVLADKPVRSRSAQAQAGGADRRPSDDGGHYITARFNGPTDAFNHFAQDANFNRGKYRLLEDQWASAKRAGKSVTVQIVPSYDGASKRPAVINIWFRINGHQESVKLANEPKEKRRGK